MDDDRSAEGSKRVRVRIAPSPTGDPHVGTAYMALFDFAFARQMDGDFILRIEDTDRERYSEVSLHAIIDALDWLGLRPDEGPGIGGDVGPYIQSHRVTTHRAYCAQLVEAGHAYHCFCSKERLSDLRAVQERLRRPSRYDRHCLSTMSENERRQRASEGAPHVIRMKVPVAGSTSWRDLIHGPVTFENHLFDDQILLKVDGYPTYHLAAVVDDHLMGITHVLRAEEWLPSTPKHLLLYDMLGWDAPRFAHLPLLRNPDHSKISKRFHHTSLHWYREQGFLSEALLNYLALLGWSHPKAKELFSLDDLVAVFSFDRFHVAGPVFDPEKLRWMNGVYLRKLPLANLYALAEPYLQSAGLTSLSPTAEESTYAMRCIALEHDHARTLADFAPLLEFMFREDFAYEDDAAAKWLRPAPEHVLPAFRLLIERFGEMPQPSSADVIEAVVRALAESLGVSAAAVIHPLRVAVSGQIRGPSLFHMLEVLGRERIVARLRRAVDFIQG